MNIPLCGFRAQNIRGNLGNFFELMKEVFNELEDDKRKEKLQIQLLNEVRDLLQADEITDLEEKTFEQLLDIALVVFKEAEK